MNEFDFVNKWIGKIENELPKFPDDFLEEVETEIFKLPGKILTLGSELFGQFEVVDSDGALFFQSDDYSLIKFVLYANRLRPVEVLKPINSLVIAKIVKDYEVKLDSLMKDIRTELVKSNPQSDFHRLINQIFNSLNLMRY